MEQFDAEAFARIAMQLDHEETTQQTVDRVVEFALTAVGCCHAGVTLVHRGRQVEVAAATDPVVAKVDMLQAEVGEGPCLTGLADRAHSCVGDTLHDLQWPVWSRGVAELGVRSALSIRLFTIDSNVGALNLFDPEPHRFTDQDIAVAHILAQHASVALATSRQITGLRIAVDARHLIGQAQGILMNRYSLDSDKAFAVLRRYSQDNNVKLHDVAQQLIDNRQLPDQEP